jgi:hypothetical protein
MDMEDLANFRNRVMNLSDGSTVAEWKAIAQMFGDLYKKEVGESLDGGTSPTLTAERAAMDVDIASFVTELSERTSDVDK